MKKTIEILFLAGMAIICLASCQKAPLVSIDHGVIFEQVKEKRDWSPVTIENVTITYLKNQHFTLATLFASQPINHISFNLTFDSSAIYYVQNPDNVADYNKICGIKSGADGRVNSCQLVWSYDPFEGCLKLSPYPQADQHRFYCLVQQDAIPLQIGETIHCELHNEFDRFFVILGEYQFEILKENYGIKNYHHGFGISPTFGGQEKPDHDIFLHL